MSLRSGLVGAEDKARPEIRTPRAGNQAPIGKGLEQGPKEGSPLLLGEGGRRPVVVSEGSPEHQLLKEARMVGKGGGHRSRLKEKSPEERTMDS